MQYKCLNLHIKLKEIISNNLKGSNNTGSNLLIDRNVGKAQPHYKLKNNRFSMSNLFKRLDCLLVVVYRFPLD